MYINYNFAWYNKDRYNRIWTRPTKAGGLTVTDVILEMQDIEKYFAGVHALKKVQFQLKKGEVHALMGENGAGKSTLMKVLCGIYQRDGGTVKLFGEEVNFSNIAESQQAGISIIHQELNMMNHLTVAQNIFIGREPLKNRFRLMTVRWSGMQKCYLTGSV